MSNQYKCPRCGWTGNIYETEGNAGNKGGCPVCWHKFGRYIPVSRINDKKGLDK